MKKIEVPVSDVYDSASPLVEVISSLVPFGAGEIFSQVYNKFISSKEEKLCAFFEDVADCLNQLGAEQDEVMRKLLQNEQRLEQLEGAINQAYVILRKSGCIDDKKEILKNLLINSINTPVESYEQDIFFNIVESYGVWHFKILYFAQNPSKNYNCEGFYCGSPASVLVKVFPELDSKRDFYEMIWNDLYRKNLVSGDSSFLHGMCTFQGATCKRTTDFGDRFLEYIS